MNNQDNREMVMQEEAYIEGENIEKKRGWYMKKVWADVKSSASSIPAPSPEELDMYFGDVKKRTELGMMPYEWVLDRIKAYFAKIVIPVVSKDDETGIEEIVGYSYRESPTINDLGLYLNVTRQTFFDYCEPGYIEGLRQKCTWSMEERRTVLDALTKSRQLIESFYERGLAENRNPAGFIYWLKNQKTGWIDQVEVVQRESKKPLGNDLSTAQVEEQVKQLKSGVVVEDGE